MDLSYLREVNTSGISIAILFIFLKELFTLASQIIRSRGIRKNEQGRGLEKHLQPYPSI